MAKRKTRDEVRKEAGIAVMETDTDTPAFLQHEKEGRGEGGPCKALKKPIMMPDGTVCPVGMTFDPVVEGMAPVRVRRLVEKKLIGKVDDELLIACGEALKKKQEKPGGKTTKIEEPTTTKADGGEKAKAKDAVPDEGDKGGDGK